MFCAHAQRTALYVSECAALFMYQRLRCIALSLALALHSLESSACAARALYQRIALHAEPSACAAKARYALALALHEAYTSASRYTIAVSAQASGRVGATPELRSMYRELRARLGATRLLLSRASVGAAYANACRIQAAA